MQYLITGATGHLGLTIINKLLLNNSSQTKIRVLVLPNDKNINFLSGVEICYGDVTNDNDLQNFFDVDDQDIFVIHCAGIVSIDSKYSKLMEKVNVIGTKKIVDMCIEKNVKKLIYVSSVHAIPTLKNNQIISEISDFDENKVKGPYAKTKALATKYVLSKANILNITVVHPSGIIGPNDYQNGHLSSLISSFCNGNLKCLINGGYDFCDVRDVADGIISCIKVKKSGECFILSGNYYSIKDITKILSEITKLPNIKITIPMWIAKITAWMAEIYYKIRKEKPLFTSYSLYTLTSNSNFSNEKAKKVLNYKVTNIFDTLKDTYYFLINHNLIKKITKA